MDFKRRIIVAVLAVIGIGMLLYPPAAQWTVVRDTAPLAADIMALRDDPAAAAQVQAAAEWNVRLATGQDKQTDYEEMLNFGSDGLMGRVQVPAIDADLPIYHGTGEETLRKGLGHSSDTSLPVGGVNTHAVLSAHTGMASATMLTNLGKVRLGDDVVVTVGGQVLAYQVVDINTVLPEEVQYLRIQPGRDLLTLLTCTPLGVNSHRLLVTAEYARDIAGQAPDPGFPWPFVVFGIVVVVAVGYVVVPAVRKRLAGRRDALRLAA